MVNLPAVDDYFFRRFLLVVILKLFWGPEQYLNLSNEEFQKRLGTIPFHAAHTKDKLTFMLIFKKFDTFTRIGAE